MRECKVCKKVKNLDEFYYNKSKNYRLKTCNDCSKEKQRKYREKNKEKVLENQRKYRKENRKKQNEYKKKYRDNNKEKHYAYRANYEKNRLKSDPVYRIQKAIRSRFKRIITTKSSKLSVEHLGCSVETFIAYIEFKFHKNPFTGEDMTWDNYGTKWHFDHIIPISSFDLSIDENITKSCHFTNIQPLWAEVNIRKGNKIPNYGGDSFLSKMEKIQQNHGILYG